jgi:outer membrane protein OmpA-like peptidoglycan-associated protein
MSTSVLALAKDLLTPELIGTAAGYTGETGDATRNALLALIPSVIGGFADEASTSDGATGLFHLLQSLPKLSALDVPAWIQAGKPILASLFGARVNALLETISGATGVRQTGAASLAGLAGSLVASVLRAKTHRSDPTALAELLGGERGAALAAAPAGVTSILEDGGLAFRHIVPMVFMGIVLLAIPFLYRSCDKIEVAHHEAVPVVVAAPKAEKIDLPGGLAINVLPGTINYELAKFLAGSDPVPRTFVFDHLNYEFGTTVITRESEPTLNDLVAILKAYPAVDVRLEGHTDSVGEPEANKKLSEDRAVAIEKFLVSTGIAAKRIATAGYGQEKPVESNDSEEGRARNRRLELVVVKK